MVPEGGVWNYNFMGVKYSPNMKYSLALDNPKPFFHELHRSVYLKHNDDEVINSDGQSDDVNFKLSI